MGLLPPGTVEVRLEDMWEAGLLLALWVVRGLRFGCKKCPTMIRSGNSYRDFKLLLFSQ
jgi:hypothetical protein